VFFALVALALAVSLLTLLLFATLVYLSRCRPVSFANSQLIPSPRPPHTETCSLTGGCIEKCLKGGLRVFDPPALDMDALDMPNMTIDGTTLPVGAIRRQASTPPALPALPAGSEPAMPDNGGLGIFVIPILDTPADNVACACEPVMGFVDASNTTFDGQYGELDLKSDLTLGLVKRNDTNISELSRSVQFVSPCVYLPCVCLVSACVFCLCLVSCVCLVSNHLSAVRICLVSNHLSSVRC
jgi:hypothetical protein